MLTSDRHKVVILEPQKFRRDFLRSFVAELGYIPFTFEKETNCLDNLATLAPDLLISGSLSNAKAYRFINSFKLVFCGLPALIISDDPSMKKYIAINGFNDIFVLNADTGSHRIKSAIRTILAKKEHSSNALEIPIIIGNSPEMIKIKKLIAELNGLNETVLIQGESETGKELVARAIHFRSASPSRPLILINLPAFFAASSPAQQREFRPGTSGSEDQPENPLDTTAPSVTVFLKEVDAVPVHHQGILLNLFQEGDGHFFLPDTFLKKPGNVRFIVSANTDLAALVASGRFRTDLYFRLKEISIHIPPLRSRKEDISALTDFFADKYCQKLDRCHYDFPEEIKRAFNNYHWPGNVRELEEQVKYIVLNGNSENTFPIPTERGYAKNSLPLQAIDDIYGLGGFADVQKHLQDLGRLSLKDMCNAFVEQTEKRLMYKVLEATNWNRKKAAELLDISYKSLLNKIKGYALAPGSLKSA